ncbi:PREDICTED: uncharacterized protein LOC105461029, partial [Wasmannia auropunctata]|uniref:uncharacterized protein LOC105461029 n=1 Tax=Wasmannia auropunctata TaxID=64793 RepID=UPI0005EE9C60
MTEYFIDQEKYFLLIFLHSNVVFCIGMTVLLAIGTMLIMFIHHICGMFGIASYRIEQAININILQNVTIKKILMTKGIIRAVDIHRQAMKLTKYIQSTFEIMMLGLIVCGIVCTGLNLFQ